MSAVQFTGTLAPNTSQQWFTFGWPAAQNVAWVAMPTTAVPGAAQIEWTVEIERADAASITYWITVQNLSGNTIDFEARYSYLN